MRWLSWLEPGYSLLYDFGCIHGLSDSARRGAAAGLTELAAPGATLLMLAFKSGRRMVLPRGMDKEDILALLGDGWNLEQSQSVVTEDMPAPLRRADPTIYRLYEVLQVYGPAIKALIHEDFGDGIMSAISFNLDVGRRESEDGPRVRITLDGKFLPYKW